METITFLRFYRAAYLRRGPRTRFADQGPTKMVAFLRIPSKIFTSGTSNFRIIDRNIKAIFREYFSSLHEDLGKIFKLMTFARGPRTTYCTTRCEIFSRARRWVALGKVLGEFVYLAVEICHRWTLLSATPSFQVRKNFENRQKHQRRRSAWVGQADFGKLELNNRNHSGNCQRLVMNVIHLNKINLK